MEKIGQLIHAATLAPSVGDLQPWRFIVVTKARLLQAVADSCPYEKWLYQAPLVIMVCALEDKTETYYPGKGREWAVQSCSAAAQSILLKAVDVGLAGCWVTSFETSKIKEAFHIPDGVEPVMMLALGYPDESPPKKKMHPFESYVFFNDFYASSTDLAVFKKDFGLHFRNKAEDLQQRAAYATSEKGSVRERMDAISDAIKRTFSRKKSDSSSKAHDHHHGSAGAEHHGEHGHKEHKH